LTGRYCVSLPVDQSATPRKSAINCALAPAHSASTNILWNFPQRAPRHIKVLMPPAATAELKPAKSPQPSLRAAGSFFGFIERVERMPLSIGRRFYFSPRALDTWRATAAGCGAQRINAAA
jgi:hypothetical protein